MPSPINKKAQANHQRIVELKQGAMRSFILLGKELKTNKEERYFQALGYLTFEAYIESPMVGMGRRSVYSLIAIYETFVEELDYSLDELSKVDYSKLDRILPVINVQSIAHREWFEKAKTLSQRELERDVKEARKSQNKRLAKPRASEFPDNGLEGWLNTVQCGDCLELLEQLPDDSIDCCVTSPPYWALRDFGVEGQLGTEERFHDYLEKLSLIFDEVRRVLKPDGTCWVVMGDTYSGNKQGKTDEKVTRHLKEVSQGIDKKRSEFPDKCLLQIPSRFAIEMCNRGWILRNEIIWFKPNCMPSSVKDRFTVDFEKLFFFTKSERYWFETQYEPQGAGDDHIANHTAWESDPSMVRGKNALMRYNPLGRNKRSVWKIPTQPFPDAHFAVFPEKLVETPIEAGCPEMICKKCGKAREKRYESNWKETTQEFIGKTKHSENQENPERRRDTNLYGRLGDSVKQFIGYTNCGCKADFIGGIVLDPFCGSGTTLIVAKKLGRKYIGFDINPEYAEMARKRLCH